VILNWINRSRREEAEVFFDEEEDFRKGGMEREDEIHLEVVAKGHSLERRGGRRTRLLDFSENSLPTRGVRTLHFFRFRVLIEQPQEVAKTPFVFFGERNPSP
jgi:hypothetical protein